MNAVDDTPEGRHRYGVVDPTPTPLPGQQAAIVHETEMFAHYVMKHAAFLCEFTDSVFSFEQHFHDVQSDRMSEAPQTPGGLFERAVGGGRKRIRSAVGRFHEDNIIVMSR